MWACCTQWIAYFKTQYTAIKYVSLYIHVGIYTTPKLRVVLSALHSKCTQSVQSVRWLYLWRAPRKTTSFMRPPSKRNNPFVPYTKPNGPCRGLLAAWNDPTGIVETTNNGPDRRSGSERNISLKPSMHIFWKLYETWRMPKLQTRRLLQAIIFKTLFTLSICVSHCFHKWDKTWRINVASRMCPLLEIDEMRYGREHTYSPHPTGFPCMSGVQSLYTSRWNSIRSRGWFAFSRSCGMIFSRKFVYSMPMPHIR